jgi:hypothetical protein
MLEPHFFSRWLYWLVVQTSARNTDELTLLEQG